MRKEIVMLETLVETRPEKKVPVPYEEFEEFPVRLNDFFETIARRPFELLDWKPRFLGREFENMLRPELEYFHPVYLKLYETPEAFILRAEVPGFTEKELEINVEPLRVTITGKKEYEEKEPRIEKKELTPIYTEKGMNKIYRTLTLPIEVKPEYVKAILKNGVLEITLPKLEPVKKVKVDVKAA
jgi:HSP20 family protein